MGDLLAEECHKQGDSATNEGKCAEELGDYDRKEQGEPIARKPTKMERMPPAISQPRLIERAFRELTGETSVVIARNLEAIREKKG